jgi:hypothetical protein
MTNETYVRGLRDAADFFEAHPQLGIPSTELKFSYVGQLGDSGLTVDSKEGLAFFARVVGGRLDKEETDDFYRLVAKPTSNFSVEALAYRRCVCDQVQVGEKEVPDMIVPAVEAQPETFVPAHKEPIMEWRCPVLLKSEGSDGYATAE